MNKDVAAAADVRHEARTLSIFLNHPGRPTGRPPPDQRLLEVAAARGMDGAAVAAAAPTAAPPTVLLGNPRRARSLRTAPGPTARGGDSRGIRVGASRNLCPNSPRDCERPPGRQGGAG